MIARLDVLAFAFLTLVGLAVAVYVLTPDRLAFGFVTWTGGVISCLLALHVRTLLRDRTRSGTVKP